MSSFVVHVDNCPREIDEHEDKKPGQCVMNDCRNPMWKKSGLCTNHATLLGYTNVGSSECNPEPIPKVEEIHENWKPSNFEQFKQEVSRLPGSLTNLLQPYSLESSIDNDPSQVTTIQQFPSIERRSVPFQYQLQDTSIPTTKQCNVPGCENITKPGHPLCTAHTKKLPNRKGNKYTPCTHQGCKKHARKNGYCRRHEKEILGIDKSLDYSVCTADDCFKHARKNGLCRAHQKLFEQNTSHPVKKTRKASEALAANILFSNVRVACMYPNCEAVNITNGLCLMHQKRRCDFLGCNRLPDLRGLCLFHRNSSLCLHEGCEIYKKVCGFCDTHKKDKNCTYKDCTFERTTPLGSCATHKNEPRCTFQTCQRFCISGIPFCDYHKTTTICKKKDCGEQVLEGELCENHGGYAPSPIGYKYQISNGDLMQQHVSSPMMANLANAAAIAKRSKITKTKKNQSKNETKTNANKNKRKSIPEIKNSTPKKKEKKVFYYVPARPEEFKMPTGFVHHTQRKKDGGNQGTPSNTQSMIQEQLLSHGFESPNGIRPPLPTINHISQNNRRNPMPSLTQASDFSYLEGMDPLQATYIGNNSFVI